MSKQIMVENEWLSTGDNRSLNCIALSPVLIGAISGHIQIARTTFTRGCQACLHLKKYMETNKKRKSYQSFPPNTKNIMKSKDKIKPVLLSNNINNNNDNTCNADDED